MLLLCAAAPLSAAPDEATVDADWIVSKLARPTPARTGFVELRDSPLLKAPLRISGEYRRPDADTLVREVRAPYPETTTIRAGEVTIERDGKAPRTFALARAPQLAGLQASFSALLGGDRAQVRRHYTLASAGSRRHWRLTLTPKDAAMAREVQAIVLYGRGAELRCIETRPLDAAPQRTLLAGAARDAGTSLDAAALTALCHGDAP